MEIFSAKEALTTMQEANKYEDELKRIMSCIIEAAQEGKGHVTLYPNFEYCPRTIAELREAGYKISPFIDHKHCRYSYCITWSDEWSYEE